MLLLPIMNDVVAACACSGVSHVVGVDAGVCMNLLLACMCVHILTECGWVCSLL
jgi:hypothetical protein